MPTISSIKTCLRRKDEPHISIFVEELNELNEKLNAFWEDSGHFNI